MTVRPSPADKLRQILRATSGRLETRIQTRTGQELLLLVASQAEVEEGLGLSRPYVLVSMLDPESAGVTLPSDSQRVAVLALRFHDTKRRFDDPHLPADIAPLTLEQAREICEFVVKHVASVEALVVHCHHGMSRSPAVAAAVAESLGASGEFWFQNKLPNRSVYELMLRAWREI